MFGIYPQDEYSLFDAPVQTQVLMNAGSAPLIGADPARVLLVITMTTNGTLTISPAGLPANASGGLILAQPNNANLIMSQPEFGPLVQSAWYAFATAPNTTVNIIAVAMRRHPAMYGYGHVFPDRKPPAVEQLAAPLPRGKVRIPARSLPAGVRKALAAQCPLFFSAE